MKVLGAYLEAGQQADPFDRALQAEGVAPGSREAAFLRSIYGQESSHGRNTQTSNAGARGGMQIIPSTFRSVADPEWDIDDPVDNARAGIRYGLQGLRAAGGDPRLGAIHYYGGPGGMQAAQRGQARSDPRNPDAPDTFQYADQVVSRMGGGLNLPGMAPRADADPLAGLGDLARLRAANRANAPAVESQEGFWGKSARLTGDALKGAASGTNAMIGDLVGLVAPGSEVEQFFRDNAETWQDWQSGITRGKKEEFEQTVLAAYEEAGGGARGAAAGAAAGTRFIAANPSLVFLQVAEVAPSIAAMFAGGAGGAAVGARLASVASKGARVGAGTGVIGTNAAMDAGAGRSAAHDRTLQVLAPQVESGEMTQEEAEEIASRESLGAVPVNAAIGAATASLGLGRTMIPGNPLTRAMARGGDSVTDVVAHATDTSRRSALRLAAGRGTAEFVGQTAEAVAPSVTAELVAGQFGETDPWGVVPMAAVQGMAGAGPFAAAAARGSYRQRRSSAQLMTDALNDPTVPEAVKVEARGLIVEEARKRGISEAEIEQWVDVQADRDATYHENRRQQDLLAAQEKRQAGINLVEKLGEDGEWQRKVLSILTRPDALAGEASPITQGEARGPTMPAGLAQSMQGAVAGIPEAQVSGLRMPVDGSLPEGTAPIVPGARDAAAQGPRGETLPLVPGMRNLVEDLQGQPQGETSDLADAPVAPTLAEQTSEALQRGPLPGPRESLDNRPAQSPTVESTIRQRASEITAQDQRNADTARAKAEAVKASAESAGLDGQDGRKKWSRVGKRVQRFYERLFDLHEAGTITPEQFADLAAPIVARGFGGLADAEQQLNGIFVQNQLDIQAREAQAQEMQDAQAAMQRRVAREQAAQERPQPQEQATDGTETTQAEPAEAQRAETAAQESAPEPVEPTEGRPLGEWLRDPQHPMARVFAALEESTGRKLSDNMRMRAAFANNFMLDGTRRTDESGEVTSETPYLDEVADMVAEATGKRPGVDALGKSLRRMGINARDRRQAAMQADKGAVQAAEVATEAVADTAFEDGAVTTAVESAEDAVARAQEEQPENDAALGVSPPGTEGHEALTRLMKNLGVKNRDDAHELVQRAWNQVQGQDLVFGDLTEAEKAQFIGAVEQTIAQNDPAVLEATAKSIVENHTAPTAREARAGTANGKWRSAEGILPANEVAASDAQGMTAAVFPDAHNDLPALTLPNGEKLTLVDGGEDGAHVLDAAVDALTETPMRAAITWVRKHVEGIQWFQMPATAKTGLRGVATAKGIYLNVRPFIAAAQIAPGSVKPVANLARTLGHELLHVMDRVAGKGRFVSMDPRSPLHVGVDNDNGQATFRLAPVAQELMDIYRGKRNGDQAGTTGGTASAGRAARGEADRGAVSGADARSARGAGVGRRAGGVEGQPAGRLVQTEIQAADQPGADGARPVARGENAPTGAQPANEPAGPAAGDTASARGARPGTLAGLSLEQPLGELAEFIRRAENSETFSAEEMADARQAAIDAMTEGLTYAAEAWMADPQAMKAQAPMAHALIEELVRTRSPEQFASVMTGRLKAKGVKYPAKQPARKAAVKKARAGEAPPARAAESAPARRVSTRLLNAVRDALSPRAAARRSEVMPVSEAKDLHGSIRMLGDKTRAVFIDAGHVRHIIDSHPDITPEDIAALPGLLRQPRAVLQDKDGTLQVIVDARDERGNPMRVALSRARMTLERGEVREGDPGYADAYKVTQVASMYGWDDSARRIVRGLADGTVKYLSKESVARVKELLATAPIAAQSPDGGHASLHQAPPAVRADNSRISTGTTPTGRSTAGTPQKNSTTKARFYSDTAVRLFDRGQPWKKLQSSLDIPAGAVEAITPSMRFALADTLTMPKAVNQVMARTALGRTIGHALTHMPETVVRKAGLMHDVIESAAKRGLTAARQYHQARQRAEHVKQQSVQQIEAVVSQFSRLGSKVQQRVNVHLKNTRLRGEWGFEPDFVQGAKFDPASSTAHEFARLPKPAQEVVKRVLKHGHDSLVELRRQALSSIGDEANAQIEAARKRGDTAEVHRLENKQLQDSDTFAALARIDETQPYTPLGRHGNWVVIGKSQRYLQAEATLNDEGASAAQKADARKRLRELRQSHKDYFVGFRESRGEMHLLRDKLRNSGLYADDGVEGMERDSSQYGAQGDVLTAFRKLQNLVEGSMDSRLQGQSSAALNQLMSDLYLTLLSEESARHSLGEAEKIAGFDDNMMRSFSSRGRAMAAFTASISNSKQVEDAVQAMRRQVRDGEGSTETKQDFFNEIMRRRAMGMDYNPSPIANKLLSVSSVWNLISSPSYFFVNMTQPWAMSLPYMTGKHANWFTNFSTLNKAALEVAPILKDGFFSVDDFAKLPADVRAELQQLATSGIMNVTLSHDMGRWGSDGNALVSRMEFKLRRFSEMVEAVNRVATAMTAIRLEKAKGATSEQAIAYASEVLNNTHGDYSGYASPRFMRHPVGRVMTQFRKFQIIQAGMFTRLAHEAFIDGQATAADKAIAKRALAYNVGHMAVLGGMTGLPLYGLANAIMMGLSSMFGSDEPWDTEQKLRDALGNDTLSLLLTRGIPAAAGVDLSHRVGAGQAYSLLPYTDTKLERGGAEKIIVGATGPAIGGLGVRAWNGVADIWHGEYWRGLEELVPRGVRDAMKGVRFQASGLTNTKGDLLMDSSDISLAASLGQALGLPTTSLSERGRAAGVVYETTQHFNNRTAALKNRYIKARNAGDTQAQAELREDWKQLQAARVKQGFSRQPVSQLNRAWLDQKRRERQVHRGVPYTKANKGVVERVTGE